MEWEFNSYYTLIAATLVLLIGKVLVNKVKFLRDFNIPEPVAGGLIAAIILFALHQAYGVSFKFEKPLQDAFMLIFFTSIGLSADFSRLKAGGLPLVIFTAVVGAFIVVQNFVGVGLAKVLGLDPLIGLITGSITLTGGHGTSHLSDYQAPEAVDIEFVVLDADAMKKQASISDDDLKAYYDNNQATLGSPEERRASHILVAADKSAPAAEREKAKAEAEKLLDEVRKNPAAFAEVAKRASQDDASAAHGGDLGFFRKDRGIEPAIAEAAFALAHKGDISGVVESDYGYHIVHLTDLKPADVPAFDKVKDQLKEQLLAEQAQKLAAEHGEAFRNDVYEQPDSLQPVADKLKLNIQTATNVTRTVQPDAIVKPLANAKFLSALFAPDSLERKNNTEAIEFAPGQLVAGRVVKHTPAHPRPFDEVKTAVRERLIAERAAEAARKEGTEKLAAWKAKPEEAKGLPAAITLSREETHDLPAAVVEGVLRADASALPAFIGVDLGEQGYTLARIEKIVPRSETKTEVAQQMRQQYDIAWGAAEALAYYELLKQRFKARILVEEPKSAASEEAGR